MMFPWHKLLIIGLVLAAAGAIAIQRHQNMQLKAEKETVTVQRNYAQGQVKTQQAIIGTMADAYMETQKAHGQLRQQITLANSLLQTHEQIMRKLERENETLKIWSNTALPDPVIRLRQRPAIAGSQAYRDWLSKRDALSATPDPAAHEWRPPARH